MARAARISSQTTWLSRGKMAVGEKHDHGAYDRQEKAGGMKKRAILGPRENTGDKSTHNGTADADQGRRKKPQVLISWHQGAGDESDNKSDEYGPNDVKHGVFFFLEVLDKD
jgi:hypothetical protein